MKKILFVLLGLIFISSFAFAGEEDAWTSIKFGYGNETGGLGIAYEERGTKDIGVVLGVGYFSGHLGGAGAFKYYIDVADQFALFGELGFGLLGVYSQWSYDGYTSSSYSEPIWGLFVMGGVNGIFNSLLTDAAVGIGFNPDYGAIVTLQSSVGLILGN